MEHHSIRQLRDKFGRFCAGPVLLAAGDDPLAEGGDDPLAAVGDSIAAGGEDPLAAGGDPLAAGDDPIATGGDDPLAAGGDPLAAGGDDLEVRSSSAISLNYVTEILHQFTMGTCCRPFASSDGYLCIVFSLVFQFSCTCRLGFNPECIN